MNTALWIMQYLVTTDVSSSTALYTNSVWASRRPPAALVRIKPYAKPSYSTVRKLNVATRHRQLEPRSDWSADRIRCGDT
eukprot:1345279-Prymnesium_polylepis.1